MLKEESCKLQAVFGPQRDLYYKFSKVVNGIDPTRSPDDLAQIINLSIVENLELFYSINALCISDHKVSFSGKPNPHISAL